MTLQKPQAGGEVEAIDQRTAMLRAAALLMQHASVLGHHHRVAGAGQPQRKIRIVPVHEEAFVQHTYPQQRFARQERAGESQIAPHAQPGRRKEVRTAPHPDREIAAAPGLYRGRVVHVIEHRANRPCPWLLLGSSDQLAARIGRCRRVVIQQPDKICPLRQRATYAQVRPAGESQVPSRLQHSHLRIVPTDAGHRAIAGAVIHDHYLQAGIILLCEAGQTGRRIGSAIPVHDHAGDAWTLGSAPSAGVFH